MFNLDEALAEITAALSEKRFALLGGLAVGARTEPRFTRDIDFAVAVDNDAEAESVIRDLRALGAETVFLLEQEAVGRLATVRMAWVTKHQRKIAVDLLFASSGIEHEIVETAEELTVFSGLRTRVVGVSALLALKVLSRNENRPRDAGDLVELAKIATVSDWAEAQGLVALITQRGYSRGKNLVADLADVQRQFAKT